MSNTSEHSGKRAHQEMSGATSNTDTSSDAPAAATSSSTPADSAPANPQQQGHNNLSEEERAAKRAKREERKAAIQQLEESVDPLYPGYPECRVLIYNVAKKQNVGTIVRTAVAFGATQIIVVGNRKLNTLGNQATNRFISWKHFEKFPDCLTWIRANGWKLIGVEIGARAKNIADRPFSDKTIFMLGNEGQGLNEESMNACDELVYIPQYGRGTASLNVATAASIILHHFAEWAKYPTHTSIEGFKFKVDETKARMDAGLQMKMIEDAASSTTAASSSGAAEADGDGEGDE